MLLKVVWYGYFWLCVKFFKGNISLCTKLHDVCVKICIILGQDFIVNRAEKI